MSKQTEAIADLEDCLLELRERDFNKTHHYESLDQAARLIESVIQDVDDG